MEIFTQRLKELRLKKGLSILGLAKAININQKTLSRWESEKSLPRASDFRILVKFFGVSADYLLGSTNDYDKQ